MSHRARRSPLTGLVALGVSLGVVAAVGIFAAPSASAAYVVDFANPGSGVVGKALTLSASVSSGMVGVAPGTLVYFQGGGVRIGSAEVSATGTVAAFTWTPVAAGSVNLYATYTAADGSQTATSAIRTISIAKASTTITIESPLSAKVGAATTFTATVRSSTTYVPTGTVTFVQGNGTPIQNQTLNGQAQASISVLMPPSPTTYTIKATYNPDANTTGSSSETDSVIVTENGSIVALSAPTATFIGATVTLKATVSPSTATGTVTFLQGGIVIGAQKLVSGVATQNWVPATAGTFPIVANYSRTGATVDGTVTQQVVVSQAQTPATINVTQNGSPWTTAGSYPLRNGESATLSATASSGTPVTLSVTGPCSINGMTVTANSGSGQCVVAAKSSGNATYSAASANYTVVLALGRQTASGTGPSSGTIQKKRWYRLANPGLRTNANQPVTWSVLAGKRVCAVKVNASGAVVFRAKRAGTCTIAARAIAIPGAWLRLDQRYRYTA